MNRSLPIQQGGDSQLFFRGSTAEECLIGYVRFDFGSNGKEFWHTWWQGKADTVGNTAEFKLELQTIVDGLRSTMLSSADHALHELTAAGTPIIDESHRYYGFHIDSKAHSYYVRVSPYIGDYSYIYCYLRE